MLDVLDVGPEGDCQVGGVGTWAIDERRNVPAELPYQKETRQQAERADRQDCDGLAPWSDLSGLRTSDLPPLSASL
jgi:hypothetical protein